MPCFLRAAPWAAAGLCLHTAAPAQTPASLAEDAVESLGVFTITAPGPVSLPVNIPATVESATREQIERSVNVTDSSDALKHFPSLLVRKRYIGDYNHAILSSRASGTGNSARSAVYVDGLLLSNFLGNGISGLSFPPRWSMVSPEEIERVDVLYGPFSAAYSGNSVGAVVEYSTRMPERFEAHGMVGLSSQPFSLYGTQATYRSWQASASVGNRVGDWSWRLHAQHTDSQSQPLTFATRAQSAGTATSAPDTVQGAIASRSPTGAPIWLLASGTQMNTQQEQLKLRVAHDLTPALRASYTLGVWQLDAQGRSSSYLSTPGGAPFTGGAFVLGGRSFSGTGTSAPLGGGDLPSTQEAQLHVLQGLSLKSRTRGAFDWEATVSRYAYVQDERRQNGASNTPPAALSGGPGTVSSGEGSGWTTLALKGIWRPEGVQGRHVWEAGVQQDRYVLRFVGQNTGDWLRGAPTSLASEVGGTSTLQSLWLQDTWTLAPGWKAVIGGRQEHWQTEDGRTRILAGSTPVDARWAGRDESYFSPKAALSWQWRADTVLKAAVGRAVRMPTLGELYGATSTTNSRFINDPGLRPEKSWTGELSAERDWGRSQLRLTLFAERTRDGLFTQSTTDPQVSGLVTRVQNVGRIDTVGQELAWSSEGVGSPALDLQGSLTHAESVIEENAGFVDRPGDTLGKRQPNVPRWRASLQATWRFEPRWSAVLALRHSGTQYRTLNNSDVNGDAYTGVSRFTVLDLRLRHILSPTTQLFFGVDNLNNQRYWNFHPYPQRSYFLQARMGF